MASPNLLEPCKEVGDPKYAESITERLNTKPTRIKPITNNISSIFAWPCRDTGKSRALQSETNGKNPGRTKDLANNSNSKCMNSKAGTAKPDQAVLRSNISKPSTPKSEANVTNPKHAMDCKDKKKFIWTASKIDAKGSSFKVLKANTADPSRAGLLSDTDKSECKKSRRDTTKFSQQRLCKNNDDPIDSPSSKNAVSANQPRPQIEGTNPMQAESCSDSNNSRWE